MHPVRWTRKLNKKSMSMSEKKVVHYLKDYQAPKFTVPSINLTFTIESFYTTVLNRMQVVPKQPHLPCVLDGSAKLLQVVVNGKALCPYEYSQQDEQLVIHQVPEEQFELEITTRLYPDQNKTLMGLYESGNNLYTQNEPEGFRKITYYFDRPDVMSQFTTTIIGDKTRYPVMLSNGNLLDCGDLANGRHWVCWRDPFAKPSYLFALVAGQLAVLEGNFMTKSGKNVALKFYTRPEDKVKAGFALESLKQAMKWDEERFNLEYDLDIFMVVAVGDFNMGAMENKGLNIFNTKYVLASSDTATDADFEAIEGVIGHEYFHNWTGNRVTCRDWFQLSLKEGLTVFRDQEFSADRASRAVRRIHNVRTLRSMQFAEDAGPMAHPVRPTSYVEMNNFYTLTVYEKGAEVVRMYHTLLGEAGFQKGMQLYFQRHDGQAVTCDDFRAAMADANGVNLDQFALWYSQAGTPQVKAKGVYDSQKRTFTLHLQQYIPPTPDMNTKQPMVIPVKVGLIGRDGATVPFRLTDSTASIAETVLVFNQLEQTFVLHEVNQDVVPSLLRGFSAPIKLDYPYSDDDLTLLLANDTDAFARWEAAQTLYRRAVTANVRALQASKSVPHHVELAKAIAAALNQDLDPAFKALLLQIPTESELWENEREIDPGLYVTARQTLLQNLATTIEHTLAQWCQWAECQEQQSNHASVQEYYPDLAGLRSLYNTLLSWSVQGKPELLVDIQQQYAQRATNMTHEFGMLSAINDLPDTGRDQLLAKFAQHYAKNDLVMDKYFSLIGSSQRADTLQQVEVALQHPAFSLENPNKVRSLLGSFSRNIRHFHAIDGSGYRFIADNILKIDTFNPQIASRLVQAFNLYNRLESRRRALMSTQLQRIQQQHGLSKDSQEIVDKILSI